MLIGGLLVLLLILTVANRFFNQKGTDTASSARLTGSPNADRLDLSGPVHEIHPTFSEITNGTVRFFDPAGRATLGYFEAPSGHIKIFSKTNGVSPLGEKIEPINREIVTKLTTAILEQLIKDTQALQARQEIHPTLSEITNGTVRFFDPTGKPLLGYFQTAEGGVKIYSGPDGISPLGENIVPITPEIVAKLTTLLRDQRNSGTQATQAPTQIRPTLAEITNGAVRFFDPTGKALLGYIQTPSGDIKVFSTPNGVSSLGETIKPVNLEIVTKLTTAIQERLTVDTQAQQARQEIHPTLSEITNGTVRFFDPTGKPLLGYFQTAQGGVKVYSGPDGISPLGEKIVPIAPEIVTKLISLLRNPVSLETQATQAPTEIYQSLAQITNGDVQFFNPKGTPLLGYFQTPDDRIKLFSKPSGVSPLGEAIKPITLEIVAKLTSDLQKKADTESFAIRAKLDESRRIAHSNEIVRAVYEAERNRIALSNETARAAAELATYRDHYISDLSQYSIAVLIVDENSKQNSSLSYAFADLLKREGLTTSGCLFKPAFVEDGLFTKTLTGQSDALKRLPLTNTTRSLFLGQQSVRYSTNSELQNLVTASMSLEVKAISSTTLQSFFSKTIEANGAGLTSNQAREMAQERCLAQLTNGPLKTIGKMAAEKSK